MENNTKKPIIVAVDDTAFVLDTLKAWLHSSFDVQTFLNGNDALKFLANHHVDLILLDYEMPGMTGYEVLMHIRNDHNISNSIPVIFLTAVTNDRMETEMLDRGANAYIRKPLDMTVLKSTISKYLLHH